MHNNQNYPTQVKPRNSLPVSQPHINDPTAALSGELQHQRELKMQMQLAELSRKTQGASGSGVPLKAANG